MFCNYIPGILGDFVGYNIRIFLKLNIDDERSQHRIFQQNSIAILSHAEDCHI